MGELRTTRFTRVQRSVRFTITLGAFIALLGATAPVVLAQTYPSKPVRVIVPFAAGAGTDVIARTVTQKAAEFIGQPIVIENRTGAAGNMGATAGAGAPPDGYTLTVLSTIHAANQSFFRTPGYDMARDFTPIVELGISPTLWVVRADLGADTVPQLMQLGRASPGKFTYGSGGATHPAELFRVLTKTDLTVIPYRGVAAVMSDLLAGRVDMTVAGWLDTQAHIKSGKLRAIATTNPTRLPQLPEVPAMNEFMPGYNFTLWYGFFAPAKTPPAAIARIRAATLQALQSSDVTNRFDALGIRVTQSTQAGFTQSVSAEIARWADTVKQAGIVPQE